MSGEAILYLFVLFIACVCISTIVVSAHRSGRKHAKQMAKAAIERAREIESERSRALLRQTVHDASGRPIFKGEDIRGTDCPIPDGGVSSDPPFYIPRRPDSFAQEVKGDTQIHSPMAFIEDIPLEPDPVPEIEDALFDILVNQCVKYRAYSTGGKPYLRASVVYEGRTYRVHVSKNESWTDTSRKLAKQIAARLQR